METIFRELLQKKNKWFVMLLLGVLLVVIAMPAETKNETEKYALEEEVRLKNILEQMENVGNTKVMITYKDSKTVEGIVVIADGAGEAGTVRRIMEVVQALFDVEPHRIKVIKGNQRK